MYGLSFFDVNIYLRQILFILYYEQNFKSSSSGQCFISLVTVAYWGGREGLGGSNHPEILKALQNRAKLNLIVKTVKKLLNLGSQHPQDVWKKGSKILKTTIGSQLFYISNDK